jgi:outer membrane protein OmpA-like peptidoglycan-associated protein
MATVQTTRPALRQGLSLATGQRQVLQLVPAVSRVRIVGMFFDLNKSFLLPSAMPGIKGIKAQYQKHPASNLLIVGHTDTSGDEDYNATLSVERADAVAAYLTDNVAAWQDFFDSKKQPSQKLWGTREVQGMLSALPDGGPFFYQGRMDGSDGPLTKAAVKAFQQSESLKDDGIAGPVTQQALITRYMGIDGTTLPSGITITTHGCGESFPVAKFKDAQRSPADRRVEIYFFDGPITPPPPGKTSGPDATEYPQWVAQVTETVEFNTGVDPSVPRTFALRFHDENLQPMANVKFRVTLAGQAQARQQADGSGLAQIPIPPFSPPSLQVEWAEVSANGPFRFLQQIVIDCDVGSEDEQVGTKLNNLGYVEMPLDSAVRQFQADYKVDDKPKPVGLKNGKLPPATKRLLDDIYNNRDCVATPTS